MVVGTIVYWKNLLHAYQRVINTDLSVPVVAYILDGTLSLKHPPHLIKALSYTRQCTYFTNMRVCSDLKPYCAILLQLQHHSISNDPFHSQSIEQRFDCLIYYRFSKNETNSVF
jgi:hypothetical protein